MTAEDGAPDPQSPVGTAEAAPAAVPPAAESFFDRLVGVLTSPGEAFGRIAKSPTWLVPLLIVAVISTAAGFVTFSKIDPDDTKQFFRNTVGRAMEEKGVSMPPDQLEKIVEMQVGWTSFVGRWGGLLIVPIWALLGTLFYHLIFRAFGGDNSWTQTFSFYVWGMIPAATKALIALVIVLLKDQIGFSEASTLVRAGLSFLVDPATGSKFLYGLLVSLDLFAVWTLWLRIQGGRRLPGVSRGVAIGTALVGFLIAVLLGAYNISKSV